MIRKEITIINKLGLHARASAKLVTTAAKFQSNIEITKDKKTVNAKSIMGVMTLAAPQGTVITLDINGVDEEAAQSALCNLINAYFHEEE